MDTDPTFKLAELRSQIAELGRSVRQLQKERRLSGVCSLGGVAVELDRQFPSTG